MITYIRERHLMLHEQTLTKVLANPAEKLRLRPQPGLNSIVWNIWHLLRIEDITLSRFVGNIPQVHSAQWQQQMRIAYGDMGTAMSSGDVDVLSQTIDIPGLIGYQKAVCAQTQAILADLDMSRLSHRWDAAHMRAVVAGEAVCIPAITEGVISYWGALSVGRFVVDYTQVHPNMHVGELQVIAGLVGAAV